MQSNTRNRIIVVISTGFILLFGLAVYQFLQNTRFRVVKTVPDISGTVSTSTNGFKLVFNRQLDANQDYMKTVNDPEKHVRSIKTEGNQLIVITQQNLEDKKYKFEIKNIRAGDGSSIPSVKFDYNARYKAYNKLLKEHQKLIETIAHEPAVTLPILPYLPHSTLNYKLDVVYDDEEESGAIGKPVLSAKIFLSGSDVRIDREGAIARYKQEVLDYIKSLGFNPNDYTIFYEISEY